MRRICTTVPAATGLLLSTTAMMVFEASSRADFVGLVAESHASTEPPGACCILDLYALFDDTDDVLLNVFNANIELTGAPNWVQSDLAGDCPVGTWNPQFTFGEECDSFITIGGEPGPRNTTSVDPNFTTQPCASAMTLVGWLNANFMNLQGAVDEEGKVLIARFVVAGTPAGAELTVSGLSVSWNQGVGTPASQGSIPAPVTFPYECATCGPPATECGSPEPGPRTLFLLDRTGSMCCQPRPATGETLCHDALEFARSQASLLDALHDLKPGYENSSVALWVFNGFSATPLTDGFVAPSVVENILDGLDPEACTLSTPLAKTICDALDFIELCADDPQRDDTEIFIITDGFENTSCGPCDGPYSGTQPPPSGNYDAGSWQQLVYDAVIASGIPVTTFLWEPPPFGVAGSTVPDDDAFFNDLSFASGGYYVFVPWDAPSPSLVGACCLEDGTCLEDVGFFACLNASGSFQGFGSPCTQCGTKPSCPGDFDGSGGVDGADLGAMLGAWGDNPAGDLSGDGDTDGEDLGILLGAWGPCP